MTDLLRDPATERALLSSLLLTPASLRGLLNDERLGPQHFATDTLAAAFQALVDISDRGEHPTPLLLAAQLEQDDRVPEPRTLVRELLADAAESPSPQPYARRLRDLHRRRDLKQASQLLSEAADQGDSGKLAEAERLLTAPEDGEPSSWNGKELATRFFDRMERPKQETWSWPFHKMNEWTGGGLRRQQIVLIGGWTAMGKSILFDQILERLASQGLQCHSYINEMSVDERMDRTMARLSGIPFNTIYQQKCEPLERAELLNHLSRVKVGMTECAGWSAAEIARHIRWNRWDVAGVDILHEIAHREERDLAEIAQVLRTTAKSVGCALIACVHLNDNRVTTPKRPVPVLRDVRGSGMLVRGADVVLFVHRDDTEDGIPTPLGNLFAAKVRNGQPNAMSVRFDADRMRFLPTAGGEE